MKYRKIARRQHRSTATGPASMEVLRNVEAIQRRNRASIDGMNHGDGRGRICPTPLSKEATPIVRDPFANGSPPGDCRPRSPGGRALLTQTRPSARLVAPADCRPRSPGGRGLLYPNWSMTRNDAPRMSTYVEVDGGGKAVGCGVRRQHPGLPELRSARATSRFNGSIVVCDARHCFSRPIGGHLALFAFPRNGVHIALE